MPRRIYTYDADRGWAFWNQLTTVGAIIQAPSYAIFVYNVVVSLWKGNGPEMILGTRGRWNGNNVATSRL